MLETITFKTELEELISLEEIFNIFDDFIKHNYLELIALSLLPAVANLRKNIIIKTKQQRNAELSKLLQEIENRKQQVKINLSLSKSKQLIEKEQNLTLDLEQVIYEEEQIINIYENSIKCLENKEKKIISSNYKKISNNPKKISRRTLRKNLQELKNILIQISKKHDNCYKELEDKFEDLIKNAIITEKNIVPKIETNLIIEKITINNKPIKDFYNYEPDMLNIDDELFYQLLIRGDYFEDDGTINELLIDSIPNIIIE